MEVVWIVQLREALGFIEKRMKDYGFRTEIILHDAFISLPGKASVLVDGRPVTAITQSFSLSSPPGGLSGVPVAAETTGPSFEWKIVGLDVEQETRM